MYCNRRGNRFLPTVLLFAMEMTRSGVWCILVFSYAGLTSIAAQLAVTLTSSVELDGRQAACPGEVITFTCMVTEAVRLRWIAEPFIPQSNPIDFPSTAIAGDMTTDDSGQFMAVLDSIIQSGPYADMTSSLLVTVSQFGTLNGTMIQCFDQPSTMMTKIIVIAATPSPPQKPRYTVSQYQLNNFTVAVQWESPASDGGVGIDNYILTGAGITAPITVLSNEPLMTTLTLSYNEIHMVRITASNCAGESTELVVTINYEVSCGPPPPPSRGSLGDLTSSHEGTVVTFQCSPGLVPSQQMISVCAANGRWTPDPAELTCVLPPPGDCGIPTSPTDGTVNYTTTTEGSQATFQCSAGLVPEEVMTAVCENSGEIDHWNPDPGGLSCSQPFTGQGASAGYTSTSLSTAEAVGIAIVLSSIVSFTAGLLMTLVIAYCYVWQMCQKPRDPHQPVHVYEDVTLEISRDIELKENVAYRVISQ